MYSSFVYILRCVRNGSSIYYTGMTNNPKRRYLEHKTGTGKRRFTHRFHGNLYMEYLEEFQHRDKKRARQISHQRELRIKNFSKKKKLQIININRNKTNGLIGKYIG